MHQYKKSVTAAIGLGAALAHGAGYEIPQDCQQIVIGLLVWAGGTFGVYQVTNKPKPAD